MFFVGDAILITPFDFFRVPLKPHTLFLYDSPSVFKGIGIPFNTSKGLVLIVMIGNPNPISFAWLAIRNNQIIGYIHPKNTELDVFIMVVIASLLGCPLTATTWSGQLRQHFYIMVSILGQHMHEVL
jgi:hypothetical protein